MDCARLNNIGKNTNSPKGLGKRVTSVAKYNRVSPPEQRFSTE